MARAFDALSGELKLIVGLRHQENCSFAEIAAILGSSVENVYAAYERALAEMRVFAA